MHIPMPTITPTVTVPVTVTHRVMRRIVPAGTAALALIALSACGSSDTSGSGSQAPGDEALKNAKGEVTVTLWHGLGEPAGPALDKLVTEFNADNKGKIKVKAVYQGVYTDVLAKYSAAVRSKSTPSLLMSGDISTGYIHDAGQTIPAQDLASANPGVLNVDDLRPTLRSYYSAEGKLLAVPFNSSTPLLYVNRELLKKAGLPADTPLNTLAQVAAAAEKVTAEVPGVKGLVQPFDGWWFEQLAAASGTVYCSPDNGRSGKPVSSFDITADGTREAIETVAGIYTGGAGLDVGIDGSKAISAFNAGKVAMMFNSSGAAALVKSGATFDHVAKPYPISGPKATSGPLMGGSALWVSGPGHSTAEQAASWKAVGFLTSAKAQQAFSKATGYVPVNKNAPLPDDPAIVTADKQLDSVPVNTATAGCLTGALSNIRTEVVGAMQSAFSGKTPLDKALKTAKTGADRHIAQYRKQAGQ